MELSNSLSIGKFVHDYSEIFILDNNVSKDIDCPNI